MKFLKTLFFIFLINFFYSQPCNGIESFTLTPPPPAAGYSPGTVVTVCYTMDGWNFSPAVAAEWLEGFSITLGTGWTNLTPGAAPSDCNETPADGQWIWSLTTTSTNSGNVAGPGWFYEYGNPAFWNNNAGDDWGDYGANCQWSFCFDVTVVNSCNPLDLSIIVTAGGDGNWGSFSNISCAPNPFNIYNGNINPNPLPPLGPINHN
jgi:hypothetical protein